MIAPHEVAHDTYKIVEGTIDAHLKSHDWKKHASCNVPIQASWRGELMQVLLEAYRRNEWHVMLVENWSELDQDEGRMLAQTCGSSLDRYRGMSSYIFTLPKSLAV
jgi:hypothetical protein